MITHRMSTQQPEPMVRFYKVIALSFLLVTIILLGVVVLMTSKKAEITIVAEEDQRPVSLSVAVEQAQRPGAILGKVEQIDFPHSEGYSLNGVKTVVGTATGKVTMHNESGQTYNLVKTTRLLSPDGILFRLTNPTRVPAGKTVVAEVYADKDGASGDIAATRFTVPGLSAEVQKVVYAVSNKPMKGGSRQVAVVTQDDINAAKRNYSEKVAEAYLNSIADNASEFGLVQVLLLTKQDTSLNHEVGDEAAELVLSGNSTLVVVSYSKKELDNLMSREVSRMVDSAAEKILSLADGREVVVAAYDVDKGTAQLTITQQAVVTLDADVESLAMRHFLSKRKEDIERYVLGLNHVRDVEVKFSPRWMVSSPSVPDKIKVVVKNVK
jgi:hypothetical protein